MKKFLFLSSLFFFATYMTACTYNVSMSHTSGGSTDTMDENATNTPTVSPCINIPLTPSSGLQIKK